MTFEIEQISGFDSLGLSKPLLHSLADSGYIEPTPIQSGVIPVLMSGKDVVGQAQTGTGKTAAFALPILDSINININEPQALILTPTRELAIQVCESFKKYSAHMAGLKTLAIYGGQDYGIQLRALFKGVHVVVGTPGRVMDHINRGTLCLGAIKILVLDEADEMLNMGFKEDVEWVLERAPEKRQIALFSATVPNAIREISRRFLNNPEEITIRLKTATVESTRQRFWQVTGLQKVDALARLLEVEPYDAMLVFAARKVDTLEIAEQLSDRGFSAIALNGDIPQNHRERIIDQLKSGKINVVVATDVAARGLDVDRITHVVNYDLPQDVESYVHRIGRTGRAGRSGEAIIFVSTREMRWLKMAERITRQRIEPMQMPTAEEISRGRVNKFKQKIAQTIEGKELNYFKNLIAEFCEESSVDPIDAAAALVKMLQADNPLQVKDRKPLKAEKTVLSSFTPDKVPNGAHRRRDNEKEEGMETYRIEVGRMHGVQPAHIVGAVAGETGMASKYIGKIKLFEEFSLLDLPEGMPNELIEKLKTAWICRRQMQISLDTKTNNNRKPADNAKSIDIEKLCEGGYKKAYDFNDCPVNKKNDAIVEEFLEKRKAPFTAPYFEVSSKKSGYAKQEQTNENTKKRFNKAKPAKKRYEDADNRDQRSRHQKVEIKITEDADRKGRKKKAKEVQAPSRADFKKNKSAPWAPSKKAGRKK
ncbi:MAG: DEAD/DEAH box helicase [Candidatus Ozemobacteraceae bacterium]